MPTPRSVWTVAAAEWLADGEWHSFEEVREVASKSVPPAAAIRKRRANAARQRVGHPRPIPVAEEIAIGARDMAREAIRNLISTGAVERQGDRIRMKSKETS